MGPWGSILNVSMDRLNRWNDRAMEISLNFWSFESLLRSLDDGENDILPFECPVECKSSAYKPICSRGKSYADLCILKQQICKGDIAPEIYNDVEAFPKYDKEEPVPMVRRSR